jgi:PKHD-type hydroxylase
MLLEIPAVLTPDELARINGRLAALQFVDGATTAGDAAVSAKQNLELPPTPEWQELSQMVAGALMHCPCFVQAALPKRLMNPMFNRYDVGMEYGSHTDISIMDFGHPTMATRTDISMTLFLSEPDSYDGGELVVATPAGESRVKPPAGSAVVYPSGNLHWVEKVTRGSRVAAVSWAQSYVRNAEHRTILFELDGATEMARSNGHDGEQAEILLSLYHKLLRLWSDT